MTLARATASSKCFAAAVAIGCASLLSSAIGTAQASDASAKAAAANLVLVLGTPSTHSGDTFPVVLYRVDERVQGLERLRPITTKSQGSVFVRPYYDQRFVLVGSGVQTGFLQIDIVAMDRPTAERSIEIALCPKCSYIDSYLISAAGKGNRQLVVSGKQLAGKFEEELSQREISAPVAPAPTWSDLRQAVSFGSSGGQVDGGDELRSVYSVDGRPVFSVAKLIPLDWSFPDGYKPGPKEQLVQLINNRDLVAFTSTALVSGQSAASTGSRSNAVSSARATTYWFFDKKSRRWSKEALAGDANRVRAYRSWVATEEAFLGFEQAVEAKALVDECMARSPGDPCHEMYPPALLRFQASGVRQTGRLVLLHPASSRKIVIETGDPDSEVLLIAGAHVYYRIGNRIYVGDVDGAKLTSTRVIAASPLVGGIHWAFLTKEP